ncbi:MAG TPA: proton-conducting transporter membrane subunit [Saprospiraceae bacterium]|nr:proton-conducting transporter membrane subunit [Saprospiraceae bacterium]HMQ81785.1 proton-conducting transporter membrane subunit [Saprospiraceae bacterium]
MNEILLFFLLIPVLGLLVGFAFTNQQEKPIFRLAFGSVGLNFLILLGLEFYQVLNGFAPIVQRDWVIYRAKETVFAVTLYFDQLSFWYLAVATFLTGMVLYFSKTYMHRDKGYKRFFNNVQFFYLGLTTIIMSGNLETLFIGWEIIGATSFFLIGFYRERYLPVKNALKVVSLYRIADIALLLGIWLCHHYFHHSLRFSELHHMGISEEDGIYAYVIPGVFLLAAMVKSAQFPFSSWLPRAMEGPTTSSAIFYGSLSVHIGIFLLIRLAPLWEGNIYMHWIIGGIGLVTSVAATLIARVQSSIKTQIAYSSIAQIGIMFIEIALGWYGLALVHFASNAFLRTYQLLVSPSVLSYRIHDQFFHFSPPASQKAKTFWDKLKLSIYVWSIKEFNLDRFMYRYWWMPLKKIGRSFHFISPRMVYGFTIPIFVFGFYTLYHQETLPHKLVRFLPELFASLGLVLILKSFVERESAKRSWLYVLLSQLVISLSFGYNEAFDYSQIFIYLSGIMVAGTIGLWAIARLQQQREDVSLHAFHGHAYEHPRLAFIFAIACLSLAGFPITPTFIGEDIMMAHIHQNQFPLLLLLVLNLILDGLVVFRLYSRLFLGRHKKGYHEIAYRAS